MERMTPHRRLRIVKALVEAGRVRVTDSSANSAAIMEIHDLAEMCDVVMSLTPQDFRKSMTTHIDHRIWQDVYHARTWAGVAVYLKLTVTDDVLIVSFKEL